LRKKNNPGEKKKDLRNKATNNGHGGNKELPKTATNKGKKKVKNKGTLPFSESPV